MGGNWEVCDAILIIYIELLQNYLWISSNFVAFPLFQRSLLMSIV